MPLDPYSDRRHSCFSAFSFERIGARRTRSVSLRRTLVEAVSGAPLSAAASSRSRGFENRGSPRSLAGVRLRDTDRIRLTACCIQTVKSARSSIAIRRIAFGRTAKGMAFARQVQLRQQCANIQAQGVEDLGAEAILLHFGFPDEIAHRRRAQATKESEDRALLNDSRRMSRND